jgi:hypothetical protein
MEQHALKKMFEYQHFSYLETSDDQSSSLHLNVVHFLALVLIRHLWQLKTIVFLHWCLIHAVLLHFKLCIIKLYYYSKTSFLAQIKFITKDYNQKHNS